MSRRHILMGCLLFASIAGYGQARYAYEVASIRPPTIEDSNANWKIGAEGLRLVNASLRDIIKIAFDIRSESQLENLPEWARSTHYTIEAKADDATIAMSKTLSDQKSEELCRAEMQHLLEDRFHLKVTHIHRERPVYALTVAKGGPKLKESAPKPQIEDSSDSSSETEGSLSFTSTHITATNVTMAIFAAMLSHLEDVDERVVVDKTGLTKHYDWELSWSPDAAQDTSKPSLFTAVQEQLGLKLEQDKAPIDIVVIDHLERPTEN
ncbi:TIGR03435 family protein [Terriglobus albidus]|uniref:TIGR03435 family protein n=1 Tax=Terriglobus albidus TaxID=1592106 RepID=A0A5B9EB30_9BACT|nr:TIGR03435 family protein [Terriglobus albidus]QEE27477.1 TIGR03435 family protein [Terriglobus albidus]